MAYIKTGRNAGRNIETIYSKQVLALGGVIRGRGKQTLEHISQEAERHAQAQSGVLHASEAQLIVIKRLGGTADPLFSVGEAIREVGRIQAIIHQNPEEYSKLRRSGKLRSIEERENEERLLYEEGGGY